MTPPACRLCGAALTRTLVDLGCTPLANAYVTAEQIANGADRAYPLHARVCDACLLVQVEEAVPPEALFSRYAYLSSCSSSWVEHARRYADAMVKRFGLGPRSLAIEVASNDGYLLRHFQTAGIPVLGIEPAANIAAVARNAGVPTETMFFGAETARILATGYGQADLTAANNVLAHVPDLQSFAAGFAAILRPNGVATFEFPHLSRLLEDVQFDTIYHEHYSYLSLTVVERVLTAVGLRVFDVEQLPTHGGSLRVFACHARATHATSPAVRLLRQQEDQDRYDGFADKVAAVQDGLRGFVRQCRAEGRALAAYGAAAKGNTLLNACAIDRNDIVCVADKNPEKQGRYLPGSHIPIVAPAALLDAPPDDLLVLPWNIAAEIIGELYALRDRGTRFWTAIPEMRQL